MRRYSTRSSSRSATLRVAPSSSNTAVHALPIPWAAPTMSARFPSRRKALLDASTGRHHPAIREHTVCDDGDGVGEIDHRTDVIRNDRYSIADVHVGAGRQLNQSMLFAEPRHGGARISGKRPEGRVRVAYDEPVGCEHFRPGVDHGTCLLWSADHRGDDERCDVGLPGGALEKLAAVVEDVRSGADLRDAFAFD